MGHIPEDFDLSSYSLEIPESLIAQHPRKSRSQSKLMVLDRTRQSISHSLFRNLPDHLPADSLLVLNTTKVVPARMTGHKEGSQGRVEFLLTTPAALLNVEHRPDGQKKAKAQGLIRPSKKVKKGTLIHFEGPISFQVLEKNSDGSASGLLFWYGDLIRLLENHGHIPLPPYIKRDECQEDRRRYQTVFARSDQAGSVAAPTAGLHFSPELFDRLAESNIDVCSVSLYVSYGTFQPVRHQDIRSHRMHAEYIEVSRETAQKIKEAKSNARPVVAVGTTTVRALESCAAQFTEPESFKGWTDLYIYPGYKFKLVDHLITNFHLPGSSLILMVSAFAGKQKILEAYKCAIKNEYYFFSYGDAMLIL